MVLFKKAKGLALLGFLGCYLFNSAALALIPEPPKNEAKSYILVDFQSGKILAAKNDRERMDLASLTKMMTVYVIDSALKSGRIKESDMVLISDKAWRTEGSRMFVKVNTEVPVHELLKGIIVQSGNDASIALAEYVAGSEDTFVDLMNQQAKALGMKDTHFENATGIPNPNHYSTAYDLSILARAIIKNHPDSYKLYSEKWFVYQGIKQPNRNRLLWREPFVDGIKTGHSSTAGYCLAASGEQKGMRLVSIVLGTNSDNERTDYSQQLLRYGFRFYETRQVFTANKPLKESKIWMGTASKLPLGVAQNIYLTLPRGDYDKLDAKVVLSKDLTAPVKKGEVKGKLTVKLNDQLLLEHPLIALQGVEKAGVFSQMSDYFSMKMHNWFPSDVT